MRNFFKIRRLHIWIACFAILLNALAPSISHAISAFEGRAATWVEICSIDGTRFVTIAATSTQNQGDAPVAPHAQPAQHCPFCGSHAGSFALPALTLTLPVPETGPALVPTLFYHAPRPLFTWSAASPRAPPVLL